MFFAEIDIKRVDFWNSIGMDFNDFSRKTLTSQKKNGFVNRNNNSLTYDTNKYSSLTISKHFKL
jgi:hypothetical protein